MVDAGRGSEVLEGVEADTLPMDVRGEASVLQTGGDGAAPIQEKGSRLLSRAKRQAHNFITRKVQLGDLPSAPSRRCIDCGEPARDYHHHLGYEHIHWLDVVPLCRTCHKMRHARDESESVIDTHDLPHSQLVPITVLGYRCQRCGHEWVPLKHADHPPRVCARCKSKYWDVETAPPKGPRKATPPRP